MASGPDQRFAAVTRAPSLHWGAEELDIAAYMYFADSLYNQATAVEEAPVSLPRVFPQPYAGGPLWMTAPAAYRSLKWRVLDSQGHIVRTLSLRDWSSEAAVDISTQLEGLNAGLYLLSASNADGEGVAVRLVVMH